MSKVNIHRTVMLIPAELTCSHFCTHVMTAPKEWERSVCDLAHGEGKREMITACCRELVLGSITWVALPASARWGNRRSTEHCQNADFLQPAEDVWLFTSSSVHQVYPLSGTNRKIPGWPTVCLQTRNKPGLREPSFFPVPQVKWNKKWVPHHDGLDRNPAW